MSLELDLDELNFVVEALEQSMNVPGYLMGTVIEERDRLQELEGMDFDDCAGGACKL